MQIHIWLIKRSSVLASCVPILAFISCETFIGPKYQTLTTKDSHGEINYDSQKQKICNPSKGYGPEGIYFCSAYHIFAGKNIVNIAHSKNVPINYRGTDKNWHFFDIEEKIGGGKPGEVFSFAIKANECKIIEDKTRDEIIEMTGERDVDRHYHTLLNMKGQCVVFR